MTKRQVQDESTKPERGQQAENLLSHPILWGVAACFAFYGIIPVIPMQQDLLVRYCCSHPLEYITIGLFFVGMSTLLFRWWDLRKEDRAYLASRQLLVDVHAEATGRHGLQDLAKMLQQRFEGIRDSLRRSMAFRRLDEAIGFVTQTGSSEHLDGHLRHCADLELERAQQRLGLVNTISWAVPIVGFLGTVMGITIAIANVTPDQLDQSLGEVTSGLGVAFDTTALSLSLSLVLVFSTYLIRSRQDELLNRIESGIDQQLTMLFHSGAASSANDYADAAEQLSAATERIVRESTAAWRITLDELQQRMVQTLESEQQGFLQAIQDGVSSTIESQQDYLSSVRSREAEQTHEMLSYLQQSLTDWNQSLSEVGGGLQKQAYEQQEQTVLLQRMVEQQGDLARLQQKLDESFNAGRITETLDQTLNSLTAAIQLLNARVSSSNRAA